MLEKSIEQIILWSKYSKIPIFYSERDEEIKKIDWKFQNKSSGDSLTDYLEFLSNIQPTFIILEMDLFDYSVIEDDFNSTTKDINEANLIDVLHQLKELNKILKDKHGQIFFYELCFANNGFIFSYNDDADWSSEFSKFTEIVSEHKKIDYLTAKYLTYGDHLLKPATELAKFELFTKATNVNQRRLAANLFFKDKKLDERTLYNIQSIIDYADSIIKMDIKDII